jgi:hypothetical protein
MGQFSPGPRYAVAPTDPILIPNIYYNLAGSAITCNSVPEIPLLQIPCILWAALVASVVLWLVCLLLDRRVADSNPAEAMDF